MTNLFREFRYLLLPIMFFLLFTSSIFAVAKRLDFDGDGKADYVAVRPENGQFTWYILRSSDFGYTSVQWGIASGTSDHLVPADYDGDHKTDIAVWRYNAGQCFDIETQTTKLMNIFYILSSQTGGLQAYCWGSGNAVIPELTQDFDGDGKVDPTYVQQIAGYSLNNWEWKILNSSTGYMTFSRIQPLSVSDARQHTPLPGDYDGDGKADAAIADRSSAPNIIHYIKRSSDGNLMSISFGLNGSDKVVPSDYDGDGKTDIAVRRNNGDSFNWYILNSSNGTVSYISNYGARSNGMDLSTPDEPVIADYDGDNKADIAVVRKFSDSNTCGVGLKCFYILGSSSGFFSIHWGILTDKDLSASY